MPRRLRQAERSGIPIRQVFAGDELLLGEAVLTVYRYEDGLSTNGKSLLTRIVFGDASILLTADIIGDTQTYFVKNLPKETLKADILKAPHHGITPMVVKFLETIAPEVLVMTNYRSRVDKGAVPGGRTRNSDVLCRQRDGRTGNRRGRLVCKAVGREILSGAKQRFRAIIQTEKEPAQNGGRFYPPRPTPAYLL